jgi:hypothetical protein
MENILGMEIMVISLVFVRFRKSIPMQFDVIFAAGEFVSHAPKAEQLPSKVDVKKWTQLTFARSSNRNRHAQ